MQFRLGLTYVLLIIVFLGSGNLLLAQKSTINGYVRDKSTGESLAGASILVDKTTTGAITNAYGYFSLTIGSDSCNLKVQYLGYRTIEQKVSGNQNRQLLFELEPEGTNLEEIVVTDNRLESMINQTQMSVNSLQMQQVKQVPVIFGEVDLIKVLQLMPGVLANSEGNAGFYVRGGSSDQNLILLDEAVVYNASHLFGFFSVFNSDAVKGVDLYKGGFPAKFGGRLSSVLDVKMKEGNQKKFSGSGGIGLIASRLTLEGPINKGKGSYIISGRRTYLDVFTRMLNKANVKNESWNRIPDYYFYDFNLKANYSVTEKDHIFLSGYFGKDKFGFDDGLFNFSFDWGNKTGTLRWNHIFNNKLFLNTTAIYSDYTYEINNRLNEFKINLSSQVKDLNFKMDFDYFYNDKHTIKFGFQSVYHTLRPGGFNGGSDDGTFSFKQQISLFGTEWGAYVQDDWEINSRLKANYGFRVSAYSQKDTLYAGPEPRLNLRYKVNETIALKASYTRMFQYLHLVSNSSISLPTDIWFPSTKRLKPQKGDQISAGAVKVFKKQNVSITTEFYYKWLKNQVEYREGTQVFFNPELEKEFVFGKGWSYGGEFLIEKQEGKLTGWISYTLSWSKRQFEDLNFGKPYFAKFDRRHNLNLVGIYSVSKRISLSGTFVLNSGNPYSLPVGRYTIFDPATQNFTVVPVFPERNSLRMPLYHRLDLGLIWKFKPKWGESDLTFSVYNALNRRNPYLIYFEQINDSNGNPTKFEARQISLFPIIPAITFNFKF